jgi:hypothetical protein
MLARLEGLLDGLGHLDLTAALGAAERSDRRRQEPGDRAVGSLHVL